MIVIPTRLQQGIVFINKRNILKLTKVFMNDGVVQKNHRMMNVQKESYREIKMIINLTFSVRP